MTAEPGTTPRPGGASATSPEPGASLRARPGHVAVAIGVLGELMMTAGVIVLLFVGYELWITGIFTAQAQHRLEQQLAQQWSAPAPAGPPHPAGSPPSVDVVPLGSALAVIRAPRLGRHWHWVVDEGVAPDDLAKGPGHYPKTALPGGVGNFVLSGHRTTHGAPFYGVDSFKAGDAIVVETRDTWFVYRVTGESIVDPSDIGVTFPVPEHAGQQPTQRLITLTTCNPRYSASQRLIVHGVLATSEPKSQGIPPALQTGKA